MNNTPKRLLALAATTAVAVGGSVALAAPAHADVWDSVAQCESGGNWSINTGNGYHGGLQFSPSTWRAYGGTAYAPTAAQATKAQQIAVAQKVLAGQGPGAWPVCSKKAGLTKSNGGASGGTAEAPRATTTKKATTQKASTQKATPAKKTTPAKSTTTKATTAKATTTKKATPKRATTVKATETTGKRFITVKPGDTLSELAVANHVDGGWRTLWSLNKGKVSDPNLIFVGQKLAIG
ncbi:LysM peptidoglycan-binding domain-containing protein [Propioniciclava coleopterorum]|uniref:LysM peptidoglycan-binding domain-containing protein n=1 Tax=Propioniciclava coleopterorum TaxID=2714937 RepID=A0A6G7Y9N8_9ACTN|nr:transglycosylase family protein [Propioniciclava coleopterorum]QIK73351.1 LysM peptidoglycan-binding domain-containing protein [Propioniciclava coleopterorum]